MSVPQHHLFSGTTAALTAVLMAVGLGVFSEAGPFITIQATFLILVGLVVLACPPPAKVSQWIFWPAVLFIVCVSLSFLPSNMAIVPEWRSSLQLNGVSTGALINPHWRQGVEYLVRVVVGVLILVYLAGHRVSSRLQFCLLLGFCTLTGVYAFVSMLVQDMEWKLAWDPYETFGFFPNHNLSATFLVMGALSGAGVILESFRRGLTSLVALPIVTSSLCVWALIVYSGTRMGPVLLVTGMLCWLCSLGLRYYTRPMLWFTGGCVAASAAMFLLVDSKVKERLLNSGTKLWFLLEQSKIGDDEWIKPKADGTVNVTPGALISSTADTDMERDYLDIRFAIYADTLKMIQSEPWTGVGLGMFEYVFPQYRQASASSTLCLHPESDWFWVAAESGVLTAILLLLGILIIAFQVVKQRFGQVSWPMDSACLIAAGIVPLHGFVDIPGHSPTITLAAIWLVSLSRKPNVIDLGHVVASERLGGYVLWRIAGAALIILGTLVVTSAKQHEKYPAILEARLQAAQVPKLYEDARAMTNATEGAEHKEAEREELIQQAILHLEKALTITPMESELYFQKGFLKLNLGEAKETDRAFAIQRLLTPFKPNVSQRQARVWKPVELNRAFSLMSLAYKDSSKPGSHTTPKQVYQKVLQEYTGGNNSSLMIRAFELAGEDETLLAMWIGFATPEMCWTNLPKLLNSMSDDRSKNRILALWKEHDEKGASAFMRANGDIWDF